MLGIAFLTLLIVYLPFAPYSPYCWGRESGVGPVVLAPAFRTEFTNMLRSWGIPFIRIGEVVLVRYWDWLTDPDDELVNASNKSLYALLDPMFGADVTRLPPNVRDLIAESKREHGDLTLTCELVRAVAIEGW